MIEGSHLVVATTRFLRALRERGLLVTPAESIDAARLLELVDLSDRADFYFALRSLVTSRPEDYAIFDALFDRWWRAQATGGRRATRQRAASQKGEGPRGPLPNASPPASQQIPGSVVSLTKWADPEEAEEEQAGALLAPSESAALAKKDFSAFAADELEAIQRVAARIARRLLLRPSRRWKAAARGSRVHLRRTIRNSLKSGGEIIELAYRQRKLRKTKVVALCDVSGSMDLYSRFLLQFLYGLQQHFARVETFVFSTSLSRITEQLQHESYSTALNELARGVSDWSGGTKIGESIAAFVSDYQHLLDSRTVVVVLSDGWDTGEPEVLEDAMRLIRRRARRVVWLNPLLGSASYEPLTRGMQAALPHVDVFAPVHNLESLNALVAHLSL